MSQWHNLLLPHQGPSKDRPLSVLALALCSVVSKSEGNRIAWAVLFWGKDGITVTIADKPKSLMINGQINVLLGAQGLLVVRVTVRSFPLCRC